MHYYFLSLSYHGSNYAGFQIQDNAVTIRDRDTMAQERIGIDSVLAWLAPRLLGC